MTYRWVAAAQGRGSKTGQERQKGRPPLSKPETCDRAPQHLPTACARTTPQAPGLASVLRSAFTVTCNTTAGAKGLSDSSGQYCQLDMELRGGIPMVCRASGCAFRAASTRVDCASMHCECAQACPGTRRAPRPACCLHPAQHPSPPRHRGALIPPPPPAPPPRRLPAPGGLGRGPAHGARLQPRWRLLRGDNEFRHPAASRGLHRRRMPGTGVQHQGRCVRPRECCLDVL